jgi:hypothetical protein
MHPANCYAEAEPDFAALAAQHPQLAPHVRIRSNGRCMQRSSDSTALMGETQLEMWPPCHVPEGALPPFVQHLHNCQSNCILLVNAVGLWTLRMRMRHTPSRLRC